MEELELLIEDLGLLDHKVILFTLDDKELNRNIAGLIANKIANKYQRPCCILSRTLEIDPGHTSMLQNGTEVLYARRLGLNGVKVMKMHLECV